MAVQAAPATMEVVLGGAVWAARVAVVGRTLADGAHMPTLQQRSRPKHACAHAERGTQASNLNILEKSSLLVA